MVLAGLGCAPDLLFVVEKAVSPVPVDSIIVLGGIPRERAAKAAEVHRAYPKARVLATGIGDCQETRGYLIQGGVPENLIETECASRSTKENAQFSIAILRSNHVQRAVIVTSWFHARRARACFRHFAPEIEFISMPSREHMERFPTRWCGGAQYTLQEYLKIAVYAVRWGIWPWE